MDNLRELTVDSYWGDGRGRFWTVSVKEYTNQRNRRERPMCRSAAWQLQPVWIKRNHSPECFLAFHTPQAYFTHRVHFTNPKGFISMKKPHLLSANVVFSWQRMRDSNPRKRSQSPVCYRYTNPLFVRRLRWLTSNMGIIARFMKMSSNIFPYFKKFFIRVHGDPGGENMYQK